MAEQRDYRGVEGLDLKGDIQDFDACWKNAFDTRSPRDVFNSLAKDLQKGTRLFLRFNKQSQKISELKLYKESKSKLHKDSDFEFIYESSAVGVNFSGGHVYDNKGKGIASVAQRNIFEFLYENNVEEISTQAKRIGSYVWSKMGFVPLLSGELGWNNLKKLLSSRLEAIINSNKAFNQKDYNNVCKIEDILKKGDPKAFFKIVDNGQSFLGNEGITWGKGMTLPISIIKPYISISYHEKDKDYQNYNYRIKYKAKFDFKDSDCVERANRYFYPNGDAPKITPRLNGASAFDIG